GQKLSHPPVRRKRCSSFPQDPQASEAWWKDQCLQPLEPIARASMILAFEIAWKRDLPVETFWICRPEETRFDTAVTWNEAQVNRLLFTPPVPERFRAAFNVSIPEGVSSDDSAGIYVIKQRDTAGNPIEPLMPRLIETREHPPGLPIEALQHLAEGYDKKGEV
ncbi:hypothetical protein, partial [Candidatus Entotheonella palauensis]|uniref:hypothetical protein n=1 Tax=Candidatus Entotheonella palauensis TaxID=93172 RepID=UPI001C4DE8F5